MAFDKAKGYLEEKGYADRVKEFDVSSATVELAAIAVGTQPERIAKSLTFMVEDKAVMIICAGDAKIDNSKFKGCFSGFYHFTYPIYTNQLLKEWAEKVVAKMKIVISIDKICEVNTTREYSVE